MQIKTQKSVISRTFLYSRYQLYDFFVVSWFFSKYLILSKIHPHVESTDIFNNWFLSNIIASVVIFDNSVRKICRIQKKAVPLRALSEQTLFVFKNR